MDRSKQVNPGMAGSAGNLQERQVLVTACLVVDGPGIGAQNIVLLPREILIGRCAVPQTTRLTGLESRAWSAA